MAYNFKSIADVEVVAEPTESANVLIEEDGIIKKAPKTAVGGAGGKYDAVIEIIEGSSGYFNSVDVVLGDFATLKDILDNGEFPNVLIRYSDGSRVYGQLKPCSILWFEGYDDNGQAIRFDFVLVYGGHRGFALYENGATTSH